MDASDYCPACWHGRLALRTADADALRVEQNVVRTRRNSHAAMRYLRPRTV